MPGLTETQCEELLTILRNIEFNIRNHKRFSPMQSRDYLKHVHLRIAYMAEWLEKQIDADSGVESGE